MNDLAGKSCKPKRVVFLLLVGLLIRLVWAWLPEKYLFYLVSDDAYYYFTVARNLATRGILSADGITLTNGFHPLWLFVITPIFFVFHFQHWLCIHLALTLAAILDTVAAFLIYKTLEKLGKENIGFWAAAFYLFNAYGIWNTMNGLETGLNNFLLAALLYLSVSVQRGWLARGWLKYGAVCGLALLSRTDNVFVVGMFLLFLLWQHKDFGAVTKTAGLAVAVAAPWLVFNYATFGSLVQTSGSAYPFLNHDQYLAHYRTFLSGHLIPYVAKLAFYEFTFNAFHYGHWILTALIGLVVLYRLKNWEEKSRKILWALGAAGLFAAVHLLVRWSVRPWYAQEVFVLTLPAVALAIEKANRFLVALVALVVLFLSGFRVRGEPFPLADRSYVILHIVNNIVPPSERVGVFNSGFTQYFTDRKVINLDGLVNNEVLTFYRNKRGLEYLEKEKIGWIIDQQTYITRTFGPYWGAQAESSFVLTSVAPDVSYPGNTVYAVQFLPNAPLPDYGRRLRIFGLPAAKSWGPVPLLPRIWD